MELLSNTLREYLSSLGEEKDHNLISSTYAGNHNSVWFND
jgi:hypothetical protein